jgi:hypothetical protein
MLSVGSPYLFFSLRFPFLVTLVVFPAEDPSPLTITMVLRDFRAFNDFVGHPDFNNLVGYEKGITTQYLTYGDFHLLSSHLPLLLFNF